MDFNVAKEAATRLQDILQYTGSKALILGTGAQDVMDDMKIIKSVAFNEITSYSQETFHELSFHLCELDGKEVLLLSGRLHYYEGFSVKEVTAPIRILQCAGISKLLMTNASGGLNADYEAGTIVLVKDHINLLPDHPLRGENDPRYGIRFPDMSEAYDQRMRQLIKDSWSRHYDKEMPEGVYVCFQGPSLETPAEYNYLKLIGGDLVGMSTVPEVIVANHAQMSVAVLSIVTNSCHDINNITETTAEDVIKVARRSSKQLIPVISDFITG